MQILLKNKYRQLSIKAKIILAAFIILLCLITAAAQPLRVSASEVSTPSDYSAPLSSFGVGVAEMYSSGVVGAIALASTGVGVGAVVMGGVSFGVFVAIVISTFALGMCAALTIRMIADAINYNWQWGYLQDFLDRLVSSVNGGFLSVAGKKIAMGATFFSYAYDWVKDHIVGYFDEKHSNTDLSQAVDGFEVLVPSYHFDHKPTNDEVINHVYPDTNNLYGRISWVYSDIEGQGAVILEKSAGYVLKSNPNTNINYQLGSSMWFKNVVAATRHLYNYIVLTDDINFSIETYFYSGEVLAAKDKSSTYYFCVPFVYEENNVRKLFVANYSSLTTNGATSDLTLRSHLNLAGTNKHYYLNGDELCISYHVVYTYNGQQNISLVYKDGTVRNTFTDINEFLYYACCTSCDLQFIDRSSAEVSDTKSNTNITYTTVNNYYNEKKDILKNTADTVRTGVRNGTITDTAEGTIGLTITDTATAEAGEVSDTSVITDTAAITDVTATDVVVNGEVVIPSADLLTLPMAFIIAGQNIKLATGDIKYKFPFDVISSVANWLKALVTPGEPLIIDYDFNVPGFSNPVHVHIDFSRYSTLVIVGNWVIMVSVAIGCLIMSKKALEAI